jgi:hypothetical protein
MSRFRDTREIEVLEQIVDQELASGDPPEFLKKLMPVVKRLTANYSVLIDGSVMGSKPPQVARPIIGSSSSIRTLAGLCWTALADTLSGRMKPRTI